MTKDEFLEALRQNLRSLPEAEQQDALHYYKEYLDEAGPENEAQVLADLGDPVLLAKNIIANSTFALSRAPDPGDAPAQEETPPPPEPESPFQEQTYDSHLGQDGQNGRQGGSGQQGQPGRSHLPLILIILTSVIWGPLLITFLAGVISLLAGLVAAGAGLFAGLLGAAATTVAGIVIGVPLSFTSPKDGLLLLGMALVSAGLLLLLWLLTRWLFATALPWAWKKIKALVSFLCQKLKSLA